MAADIDNLVASATRTTLLAAGVEPLSAIERQTGAVFGGPARVFQAADAPVIQAPAPAERPVIFTNLYDSAGLPWREEEGELVCHAARVKHVVGVDKFRGLTAPLRAFAQLVSDPRPGCYSATAVAASAFSIEVRLWTADAQPATDFPPEGVTVRYRVRGHAVQTLDKR